MVVENLHFIFFEGIGKLYMSGFSFKNSYFLRNKNRGEVGLVLKKFIHLENI